MAQQWMICACSLLLIAFCSTLPSSGGKKLRTTNVDKQYERWTKKIIYYYLDPAFTAAEVNMINQAINRVTVSLSSCIVFSPVSADALVFKVKFTPLTAGPGSAPQTVCWSYPGVNIALRQTSLEQIVSLARGPTGCLDSYCSVQKYIAVLLGKRNEHQRADRDSWITVQPDTSLATPNAYRKYDKTEAYWTLFPYDYCSITHNQPTEFAKSGVPAFTIPAGKTPSFIPKLCQLSTTDCKLISMMYQCNSALCANIDCASQKPVTLTTDPCPASFCTATPDDAVMLLNKKVVVFSGTCAMEIDPKTGQKMGAPVKISTLFPGVTGPVQVAWQSDANTIKIFTQASTQFSCTATACTSEQPYYYLPGGPTSVFEYPPGPTFDVKATGTTYRDPSLFGEQNVGDVFPFFGISGTLSTWIAAYRTGTTFTYPTGTPAPTDVVNVIGMNGGVLMLQPMTKKNADDPWVYTAEPKAISTLWCPSSLTHTPETETPVGTKFHTCLATPFSVMGTIQQNAINT